VIIICKKDKPFFAALEMAIACPVGIPFRESAKKNFFFTIVFIEYPKNIPSTKYFYLHHTFLFPQKQRFFFFLQSLFTFSSVLRPPSLVLLSHPQPLFVSYHELQIDPEGETQQTFRRT
jgi:hypothetical protein